MKKRIIFVGLCFVLLLVFTSLSYAGYDARALPIKEHPHQELCSPPSGHRSCDILLLVVLNGNNFALIIRDRDGFVKADPISQKGVDPKVKSESNSGNKHERSRY